MLRLNQHFDSPGKILDIGCGTGNELDVFARLGWHTYGTDISADATNVAAQRGHNTVAGSFPTESVITRLKPGAPFDLIFMHHSLEHLRDPVAALSTAGSLLTSDGLLFVATPNAGGYLARRGILDWWQLDAPRHLVLFTRAGFELASKQIGLQVMSARTYSNTKGWVITRRLRADANATLREGLGSDGARAKWPTILACRLLDVLGYGDNLHVLLRREP